MDYPKLLISGFYNVFKEGWNSPGVYMCSGLYKSETFKQPIYVGSAWNLQYRIEHDHIQSLERNNHPHNLLLQFGWNKHGKENFIWWLLEICSEDKTLEFEQKYLDMYRPFVDEFNGFNISHYAESGMKGRKHTQEARKKMSKAHKGKPSNMKGKHLSEESKKKLSNANKGKMPFNYGKKYSSERKAAMSKITKLLYEQGKIGTDKKIICKETGIIYDSITKAALSLNINGTHISSVCSGKRKTCGGYHWEYVKKEEKK